MKKLLYFSLLIHILCLVAIIMAVQRLGGWRYTMYKLSSNESGLYNHRRLLFEKLPPVPGSIIFLGDSQIEQCEWSELLHLDSIPVLNRGITSDQTHGLHARLDEVLRHQPTKVFLVIGINDLLMGISENTVEAQYRQIVQKIRGKSPDTGLFIVSVLPINNEVKNIGIKNDKIQAMNTRIIQICKDYTLPYIDLYSMVTDASGNLSAKFTDDGIHLNALGYVVWKNSIAQYIN
jgi:lysophospholipase L1-like esterase